MSRRPFRIPVSPLFEARLREQDTVQATVSQGSLMRRFSLT